MSEEEEEEEEGKRSSIHISTDDAAHLSDGQIGNIDVRPSRAVVLAVSTRPPPCLPRRCAWLFSNSDLVRGKPCHSRCTGARGQEGRGII